MTPAQELEALLKESRSTVFFGGAGVSTASGIPDFRSVDGLYHQTWDYPPEEILSHTFFEEHPGYFFDFYRQKLLCLSARPNMAHIRLAQMEAAGRLTCVVTQNIDGLHQAAGSKRVYELHGSIHRNHCRRCGKFYDAAFVRDAGGLPRCTCGGLVKPDVVLYEEALPDQVVEEAVAAISRADLLVIGGTSLAVYPAAGLVDLCPGKVALINKSSTPYDRKADLVLHTDIAALFEALTL